MKHFISGLIYVMGISFAIYTIPSLRTLSVSLFAGAGVVAVIIGFASQAAFSNIVSGIFISIFKPFRVGDRIKIQNIYGIVEDITLRHTIIKTYENIRYIIPNSKISEETIENKDLGDERIRKFFEIGISYDSDVELAMKIVEQEIKKHPDYMSAPENDEFSEGKIKKFVKLVSFGDSSINLRARVWTKNVAASFRLTTDVNLAVKKRFDKEGIEIPFPHRTIVYKTDVLKERKKLKKKK
jgi:small-conductance mechanosensitive channel